MAPKVYNWIAFAERIQKRLFFVMNSKIIRIALEMANPDAIGAR